MTWYQNWFDSPHYHLLYGHRDRHEAELFIAKILNKMELKPETVLDNSCGKGRHVLALAKHGFEVWGTDISNNSIREAAIDKPKNVHFETWDMRNCFKRGYFNVVFNLFTSFGYFETPDGNKKALDAVVCNLKPNGYFVQDYLNASCLQDDISKNPIRFTIDEIDFEILKFKLDGQICKEITVSDKGQKFRFIEKVDLLSLDDFESLYKKAGLKISNTFGSYDLEPWATNSERLIIVSTKT